MKVARNPQKYPTKNVMILVATGILGGGNAQSISAYLSKNIKK